MKKVGSMSKNNNEDDEEEDKPKYKRTKKEDFIFKDLKTAYVYWLNFLPENTHQEYIAKKNCVRIGCALLRTNNIEFKNDDKNEETLDSIIENAKEQLKKSIPSQRVIGFDSCDVAGKKFPVYKITSTDAGESHAREDEWNEVSNDFRDQQYEHCIKELEDVDVKILGILIKNDIIPTLEPPLDELMIKLMRIKFNKKLDEYTRRMKDATST